MGEFNKIAIALVFMCLPLGCAAPVQEAKEIQCTDRDGQILYTGPYIEERWNGYLVYTGPYFKESGDGLVHLEDQTDFFPKDQCVKMPA